METSLELQVWVEELGLGAKGSKVEKVPVQALDFALDGILGDKHGGFTKKADGRDRGVKRGTPIRNWRQWSAVAVEELEQIALAMGVDRVEPAWLGANIAFSGCASLTQIPKGSMIWFASGLILSVEGENAPCVGPGKVIASHFPKVQAADFPRLAKNLRGLVGTVYRAGQLKVGDQGIIRLYQPYDALPRPPKGF